MAEQGKPLNAQVFSEIYEKLFKEYNGDSLVFDEEVKYGWARIPHFYRPRLRIQICNWIRICHSNR